MNREISIFSLKVCICPFTGGKSGIDSLEIRTDKRTGHIVPWLASKEHIQSICKSHLLTLKHYSALKISMLHLLGHKFFTWEKVSYNPLGNVFLCVGF